MKINSQIWLQIHEVGQPGNSQEDLVATFGYNFMSRPGNSQEDLAKFGYNFMR